MAVESLSIAFSTKGNADIIDITGDVERVVKQSAITNGTATIFCPSSTSGLTSIEYESGCISDLKRLFDEIVDPMRDYAHNARWGDGNGHSHVRAAMLGASFTVPIIDNRMTLGTWQQIIYVDFDNRPRKRNLVVLLNGE